MTHLFAPCASDTAPRNAANAAPTLFQLIRSSLLKVHPGSLPLVSQQGVRLSQTLAAFNRAVWSVPRSGAISDIDDKEQLRGPGLHFNPSWSDPRRRNPKICGRGPGPAAACCAARRSQGEQGATTSPLAGRALNNSRAPFLQDLCQQLRTDLARFAPSLSSDMSRAPSAKRTEPVPPASRPPTWTNRKPLISKKQCAGTPLEMQYASQPGILPCNTFTAPSFSPRC